MASKESEKTDKQHGNSSNGAPQLDPYKFKPGQSGNPNGRPKRKTITERMAAIMELDSLEGVTVPEGQCVGDVFARQVVIHACHGRFPYAKELLERLEGKVPDRIIDETSDADADRERSEVDAIIAALRDRGGIAIPQAGPRTPVPGSNGNGHVGGQVGHGPAPGPAE
jgi:Family of unknown function (DUF5681)